MPTNKFIANAAPVSQVNTVTPATVVATDTFTLVCNGKSITVVSVAGTVAEICTLLAAAVAASAIPEFQEVSANGASGTVLTLTARTPGQPFTITSSAAGTGSPTLTTSVAAGSGPSDASLAGNWSQGWTPQGACAVPTQANAVASSGGSLSNGTTYYWVVTAVNQNGETTKSNEKSLAISTPNLQATISWAAINGATGYRVYRTTSSGTYGGTSLVAAVAGGSTVSYLDTGTSLVSGSPSGSNTAVGDDVVMEFSSVDLLWNLDKINVAWNSLTVRANFTGRLGLPFYNPSGYAEYRPCYLLGQTATITIGDGPGAGSGRVKLDCQTTDVAITVYKTAASFDTNYESLQIKNTTTGSTLAVYSGIVGVAVDAGTTATIATLTVGLVNGQGDASVRLTSGVTITTINQNSGTVVINGAVATWAMQGGVGVTYGAGAVTTLTVDAGSQFWESSGTITTLKVGARGVCDFSKNSSPRTVTNATIDAGATLLDPYDTVTWSGGILLNRCRLEDVTLDLGFNLTLVP